METWVTWERDSFVSSPVAFGEWPRWQGEGACWAQCRNHREAWAAGARGGEQKWRGWDEFRGPCWRICIFFSVYWGGIGESEQEVDLSLKVVAGVLIMQTATQTLIWQTSLFLEGRYFEELPALKLLLSCGPCCGCTIICSHIHNTLPLSWFSQPVFLVDWLSW